MDSWGTSSVRDFDGRDGAASGPLRVLVVERSRLYAEALMMLVESDPSLQAIGYASDGWAALGYIAIHDPDVVIVGPATEGLDAFELTRVVHELFPRILVIVLLERLIPAQVEAAYAVGVADCIPTNQSADDLLCAISDARARQLAFERGRQEAERREAVARTRRTRVVDDRP